MEGKMIRVAKTIARSRRGADLAIVWLVVFGWLIFLPVTALWPASFWYSLDSIIVTDETVNGERIIDIDRTIQRPFSGRWRVEEQILLANGRYAAVQVCFGISRYRPDKSPPDPATLAWWKGPRCRYNGGFDSLPAGTYRLCTWVTIRPAYFPEKEVERCSPDFTR